MNALVNLDSLISVGAGHFCAIRRTTGGLSSDGAVRKLFLEELASDFPVN